MDKFPSRSAYLLSVCEEIAPKPRDFRFCSQFTTAYNIFTKQRLKQHKHYSCRFSQKISQIKVNIQKHPRHLSQGSILAETTHA